MILEYAVGADAGGHGIVLHRTDLVVILAAVVAAHQNTVGNARLKQSGAHFHPMTQYVGHRPVGIDERPEHDDAVDVRKLGCLFFGQNIRLGA